MKHLHLLGLLAATLAACAAPAAAQITITPSPAWTDCAAEEGPCKAPVNALVRYGAAAKFVYRIVAGPIDCNNRVFGDPALNVVKRCSFAAPAAGAVTPPVVVSPTPAPVPTPTATPLPAPAPAKLTLTPRARLGINVTGSIYWSNEAVYANQAKTIEWVSPTENWTGIARTQIDPAGFVKSVEAGKPVVAFLNPPVEARQGKETLSRCTWRGTGNAWLGGYYTATKWGVENGLNYIEYRWKGTGADVGVLQFEIRSTPASDPIRDLDCRIVGSDPKALFAPQMLDYHKPFGVVRFLDWSAANANPPSVTWATRSTPGSLIQNGVDGVPLEERIAFANANGSSPWETIPWNADADYIRRMAQLYHDGIPAGRPIYVEISNETWNYGFGVLYQTQKEGVERKLADNPLQAGLARYAQKITEVMPIWEEVFKDRPSDLVRVAASQSANPWIGENVLSWNDGAATKHLDAYAVAPYFAVGTEQLTTNQPANMALIAAEAKRQITVVSKAQKALADKYKLRLIAYEGGQHQLDPGNRTRLAVLNRDPAMAPIYKQYLTDWSALNPDVFALYAATGAISEYGAWGLREYSGQPVGETPKLRGVLNYVGQ